MRAGLTVRWVPLALVVVLALGLRLYRLGHDSFWLDEIASVEMARQSLPELVQNYRPGAHQDQPVNQAPLAFLMFVHFFLSSPISEATSRLPAVLLGTAAVLALFLFARRLVLSIRVALLAALLLAVSPLHVWYSQEVRWYAQWIFLTILSYWALSSASDTRRARSWIAYWLCTVLNVYTFVLSFFVIACQGVSVLLLEAKQRHRNGLLRTFLSVQLAVVVAATPLIWLLVNRLGAGTGDPRPPRVGDLPYTLFAYSAGYSAGPTLKYLHSLPKVTDVLSQHPVVIIFAMLVAPLTLLGARRALRTPNVAMVLLPWCFGPPLLAWFLSLVSNVTYEARYGSAALPAFILLLALGIRSLKMRTLQLGAAVAVLACSSYSLANHYWEPEYAKEDIRGAVAHVRAATLDGAPVVVIGQISRATAYYGAGLPLVYVNKCSGDNGSGNPLNTALDGSRELWLLIARDWDEVAPQCLEEVAKPFQVIAYRGLPGAVDLWRFRKRERSEEK